MKKFSILILLSLFATNSLDKAESVKVKLELKTFDEIFGEGWWDKNEAEDFKTQAPKNPPLTESDHSGQIEPNSTDLNLPLTEFDHSDYAKNGEEENDEIMKDKKRKIIDKFNAIKVELKQKGQYSDKERNQIEQKIAKHLKVSRSKIYKWKKEFGLSRKSFKNEQKKILVEKFDQMKAELKRAGFKNSYPNQINETVAKKLGLSLATISNWKSELGQTRANYSDDEKLEIVKKLMQMKSAHSGEDKKSCKEIAERFGINIRTINKWKKEFGLSQKVINKKNERQNLVKKFDLKKAELKRDGFKNSYKGELDKTVAKQLGLNFTTIYAWKRELSQTKPQHKHSHNEQKKLMNRYYEIKDKNSKMSVGDIAKMLKIGRRTLYSWKKQFKRQQFHQNSVNGHSVEENAAANVQEIESTNSWSI